MANTGIGLSLFGNYLSQSSVSTLLALYLTYAAILLVGQLFLASAIKAVTISMYTYWHILAWSAHCYWNSSCNPPPWLSSVFMIYSPLQYPKGSPATPSMQKALITSSQSELKEYTTIETDDPTASKKTNAVSTHLNYFDCLTNLSLQDGNMRWTALILFLTAMLPLMLAVIVLLAVL